MSKYINADEIKNHIAELTEDDYYEPLDEYIDGLRQRAESIIDLIDEMPSADVRENIHGKWIAQTKFDKILNREIWCAECSVCGEKQDYGLPKYCMHCGADMRGNEDG